jgi:hypothetical protein
MSNQITDGRLNLFAAGIQICRGLHRLPRVRAHIRLLPREKLRVYRQAVLQIVNSQFGSLAKADRA